MSTPIVSRMALRRGASRPSIVSTSIPRARFLSSGTTISSRLPRLAQNTSSLRSSAMFQASRSQRRNITDQTRSAIQKAIDSSPVVLFMKGTPSTPQCGFSRASIQILSLQGLDPSKFAAFNVLEDAELRQGIKEFSDWPTIPQLYVDGEFVGGTDILQGMYKSGELETLLEGKGYLVPVSKDDEAKA